MPSKSVFSASFFGKLFCLFAFSQIAAAETNLAQRNSVQTNSNQAAPPPSSSHLREDALEELKPAPTNSVTQPTPTRPSHPVEIEDSAQGVLKLENPYDSQQTRAYKMHLFLLGQKYQPRGRFNQEIGPPLQLREYSEMVLPSLEISSDKLFSADSNFSWGAHLKLSYMTQNQRFAVGNSKTDMEDAQLHTLIAQIGPNLKFHFHEKRRWGLQLSGGTFQQTQTSPSAYLRYSTTHSLWSASTGPEVTLFRNTLATLRYEYRALTDASDTVAIQNDNLLIGFGYLW